MIIRREVTGAAADSSAYSSTTSMKRSNKNGQDTDNPSGTDRRTHTQPLSVNCISKVTVVQIICIYLRSNINRCNFTSGN